MIETPSRWSHLDEWCSKNKKNRVEKKNVFPMIQRWKKKKAWLQKEKNNVTWKQKKALDQIKKRKRTSDLLKTHQRSKDFAKIKVEYIFSTISSSGFLMSTIRKRMKTHETHTHINTKSIPNCPNNIKKLSLSYQTLLMSIQHQRLSS